MSTVFSGLRRRSAVTLVEVLVVIGIIGILVSMILPAVQQVRATAQRVTCQNRLRQIGLGLHGYHDANGAFPIGQDRSMFGAGDGSLQGVSWLAKILPFVGQDQLFQETRRALAQDRTPWNNPPHLGLATVVPLYTCPSDSRIGSAQRGADGTLAAYTSYHGVRGEIQGIMNGVLVLGLNVRIADITDGTSQTAMVGERPPSARLDSGWWYTSHESSSSFDFLLNVEMFMETLECLAPQPGGKFVFGPGRIDNECDMYHYWSLHIGGANFLFADGSVRFLAYSAAPIMPALASRDGGEVVDLP